ncbi:MAG: DUF58 domain-containing protein [Vagococcus sp.]|uniref:DUF58 domain-containing protein n=1 Tax=Vagococcus sp. TaxID=1933889 RepID=UPI002FC709E4
MRKNRILVGLIWFFLLFVFFIQNSFKPIVVLAFLTIVIVIDLIGFIFSKKAYHISTHIKGDLSNASKMSGCVKVTTPNHFLLNKMIINLSLVNQLTNEEVEKKLVLFPVKKKEEELEFELQSEYCGNLQLIIKSVQFSDLLGLVKLNGQGTSTEEAMVIYPKTVSFQLTSPNYFGNSEQMSLVVNQNLAKQGDMFDFKTYEVGDPVKNIHWKLSMKEQELIVRELSEEAAHKQLVILETNYLKGTGQVKGLVLHAMIASFVSVMEEMCTNHQTVSIGWFSQSSQSIQVETISSVEDLQIIEKCIADISYQEAPSLVWHYFREFMSQISYSRIIYIHPDVTGDILDELPQTISIAVGDKTKQSISTSLYINANQYEADITSMVI